MVTIYDIADATGFSISTVSRALRELPGASARTRRIVRATADELGYEPLSAATALAGGRLRVVGVVVGSLAEPQCAAVVESVSWELRRASYDLLLIDCGLRHPSQKRDFSLESLTRKVDAIMGIDVEFSAAETRAFADRGKPVATIRAGAPLTTPSMSGERAARDLLDQI